MTQIFRLAKSERIFVFGQKRLLKRANLGEPVGNPYCSCGNLADFLSDIVREPVCAPCEDSHVHEQQIAGLEAKKLDDVIKYLQKFKWKNPHIQGVHNLRIGNLRTAKTLAPNTDSYKELIAAVATYMKSFRWSNDSTIRIVA